MRQAIPLLLAMLLAACAARPTVQSDVQRTWDVEPCEHCMT